MQILKKLKKLISESNLQEKEKEEFYSILGNAPQEELVNVIKLFEEDKKWVTWIYENYKKKRNAFNSKKINKLEEILDEEKKLLDELEKEN